MKTPIQILLEQVKWEELSNQKSSDTLPFATHQGILELGPLKLEVVRLNTGQALITEESMIKFLDWLERGDL